MRTKQHAELTRLRLEEGNVSPHHADETQCGFDAKCRRINPLIGRVGLVQVQSGGLTPKQLARKMRVKF